MKPKCFVLFVFSILAPVILADQYSRGTPKANSGYALSLSSEHAVGLSNVVQKAVFYLSKESNLEESNLEICGISYRKSYKALNDTNKAYSNKEYSWVWEVYFVERKKIGHLLGGGFKVIMADTPNCDLMKIQRGK